MAKPIGQVDERRLPAADDFLKSANVAPQHSLDCGLIVVCTQTGHRSKGYDRAGDGMVALFSSSAPLENETATTRHRSYRMNTELGGLKVWTLDLKMETSFPSPPC